MGCLRTIETASKGRACGTDKRRVQRYPPGHSSQQLADQAILSINAVKRLENGQANSRISTVMAIKTALEKGGVEFVSPCGGKGEGGWLRAVHGSG